ncbi:expressed unknown protein [Seminavis robusta]|uniref:Uncharacterized protein n=1 Tax=Seminavis robusta TaxID=568900 RepID=A0A9N8HRJ0_9STRA|nr:expressed unknown protein [Seminavis robusta]|eukprot:Sro1578_g283630.1 n/a (818) ;mRNA; r:4477-6930
MDAESLAEGTQESQATRRLCCLEQVIRRISIELARSEEVADWEMDQKYEMDQDDLAFIMATLRKYPAMASRKFHYQNHSVDLKCSPTFCHPFALLLMAKAPLSYIREVYLMFPMAIQEPFESTRQPDASFPLTVALMNRQQELPLIQFLVDAFPGALFQAPVQPVPEEGTFEIPNDHLKEPEAIKYILHKYPQAAFVANIGDGFSEGDLLWKHDDDYIVDLVVDAMARANPSKKYVYCPEGSMTYDSEKLWKLAKMVPHLKDLTIFVDQPSHLHIIRDIMWDNYQTTRLRIQTSVRDPCTQDCWVSLQGLLRHDKTLEILEIVSSSRRRPGIDFCIEPITSGLMKNGTVKSVRLHGMVIPHTSDAMHAERLLFAPNLSKVELSKCAWPQEPPSHLCQTFQTKMKSPLTHLWIIDVNISEMYLSRLLAYASLAMPHLKSLRLQLNSALDFDVMEPLLSILAGPSLKLLETGNLTVKVNILLEALETNTTLTHLQCSAITGNHGQSIVDLLEKFNFTLQHIGAPEGSAGIPFQLQHAAKIDYYTGINAHGRAKVTESISLQDLVTLLTPTFSAAAGETEVSIQEKLDKWAAPGRVQVPNYEDLLLQSNWHTYELNLFNLQNYILRHSVSVWSKPTPKPRRLEQPTNLQRLQFRSGPNPAPTAQVPGPYPPGSQASWWQGHMLPGMAGARVYSQHGYPPPVLAPVYGPHPPGSQASWWHGQVPPGMAGACVYNQHGYPAPVLAQINGSHPPESQASLFQSMPGATVDNQQGYQVQVAQHDSCSLNDGSTSPSTSGNSNVCAWLCCWWRTGSESASSGCEH